MGICPYKQLEFYTLKIIYILRTSFGLMGTNASYFMPKEIAKTHEVMILEGPSYESEGALAVVKNKDLNIKTVDEKEFEKRFSGICKYIDEFKPDIIHIFYHHQALQLGKALRKKYSSNIKLILDIRSALLEERLIQRIFLQVRALFLQGAFDIIATNGPYVVKTVFPLCWRPVRELNHGVDCAAFKVRNTAWQTNNIDLVYTGAIAKKRNIENLLMGFKTLLEEPNASQYNFTLHLYGTGNRFENMKQLSQTLKIDHSVIFHGLIDQEKLSNILNTHSIGIGYVPFGIYKNAPALKTLEYICAGLSVLASDTQPTKDLLELGFKIETYDNSAQGFADGVLRLCEKGWEEASVLNNINLIKQFDWQNIVQNSLIPIYQKLNKK